MSVWKRASGMARKSEFVTLRVDATLAERTDRACLALNVTRSALTRKALLALLAEIEKAGATQ